MERLTNKKEADAQRQEYEKHLKNGYPRNIPEERFLKLAAYEDTGLEPREIEQLKGEIFGLKVDKGEINEYRALGSIDHLRELAQAEKDGRLVVLPCKVGDMLYEIDLPEYGVITCMVMHIGTYNGPTHYATGNPMMCAVSVGVEVVEGHGKGSGYAFELEDFGKNVFLTREEAEAALKKREADNEID